MGNFKEDIANIRGFVFDVDGVFTDGTVVMDSIGAMVRSYNVKDGFVVATAVKKGYPVCIISGGAGSTLYDRFAQLGVKDIYVGTFEKLAPLHEFAAKYNLSLDEILYLGDDIPDVEPMKAVGISVAPADAAADVRSIARYVSAFGGGKGCVRDVVEQVLRARGDWFDCGNNCTTDTPSA